jgi:phosphoribosylanthranilate isomerase
MTRVKICGITNVADARAAVAAGADLLGFVFADSPRRIDPDAARAIVADLPPTVTAVGVFMGRSAAEVVAVAERSTVGVVQMHDDRPVPLPADLPFAVIRRVPVGDADAAADLRARMAACPAAAYLLDPGAGSGRTFRWEIARGLGPRVYVAGGLTPANVAAAIRAARPYAVDVSGGVERSPGRKDHEKLAAFVRAVRECDADSDA